MKLSINDVFFSPATGLRNLERGHVNVGNFNGEEQSSPLLMDIKIDLRTLQKQYKNIHHNVPNPINTQDTATKNYVDNTAIVGEIRTLGHNQIPDGWLKCDGKSYLGSDYPALFKALGSGFKRAWGYGDNGYLISFRVPDLRGMFLRGVSDDFAQEGVMRDPDSQSRGYIYPGGASGNAVGSYQNSEVESHSHDVTSIQCYPNDYWGYQVASQNAGGVNQNIVRSHGGSSETRPINAYVQFIIKT